MVSKKYCIYKRQYLCEIITLTKDRRDSNCSKIFFLPTGSYFLFIFETQSKIINEENDKKEAEESQ